MGDIVKKPSNQTYTSSVQTKNFSLKLLFGYGFLIYGFVLVFQHLRFIRCTSQWFLLNIVALKVAFGSGVVKEKKHPTVLQVLFLTFEEHNFVGHPDMNWNMGIKWSQHTNVREAMTAGNAAHIFQQCVCIPVGKFRVIWMYKKWRLVNWFEKIFCFLSMVYVSKMLPALGWVMNVNESLL